MTNCVIEVGPEMVRGPCEFDQELVSAALESIDDEIALLDEQPVEVDQLWRAVFGSALSDRIGTAVLVYPTWWSRSRVARVRGAAADLATEVVALQRAHVLAAGEVGAPTIIEIAKEFVVVWRSGHVLMAESRSGEPAAVARAVADGVGATSSVRVDAPIGVDGAQVLAGAISECLRNDGLAVTTVHQDRVLAGVRDLPTPWVRDADSPRRRPGVVALSSVVASVALLCVYLDPSDVTGPRPAEMPMTLLVEGRVAMTVPAQWTVRRVTTGPGSARVEVTAPDDATSVLMTQSRVRKDEGLTETAAALRSALDDQPPGVFSKFNPEDHRADRPAVTYREVREERQVYWAVFVDDGIRIAVGCQSAPGREQAMRSVCDEAVRSAHVVV